MHKVKLGKTNILTNNIGFGGIPVQRTSEKEAVELIRHLLKKGINFFDSARGYTVSESFIGKAIKPFCREDIVLATKAPPVTYAEFKTEVAKSLVAFETNYIDIYQIHNIKTVEDVDITFSENGSFKAFCELRDLGVLRHFGITSHKREVLEYAIDKFGEKIETVMFPYNIVEKQGVEMFKKAKQKSIATIAMKPLGGGNIDNISLALKFVLGNNFIDIAIPGMGSIEEGEQDISVLESPLTEKEKFECDEISKELGNNFCRRCSYCAPCSAGLDIPGIFSMQNYLHKYGLSEWASSRYLAMTKCA